MNAQNAMTMIAMILWGIFAVAFTKDRSRYRNCMILFLALIATAEAALMNAGHRSFVVAFPIILMALLLVPVFLIWNGIVIIRREGAGLSTMLSLALGVAIAIGEAATLFLIFRQTSIGTTALFADMKPVPLLIILTISLTVLYGSVSFLMFMLYSVFLMAIPRKRDFDYVIIHGAGLAGGEKLTKLLSDRVDKAIEIYRKDPTPPYMIPSGGKGSDEKISEAEAMRRYMIEKGIPDEKILVEDRSTTTYENLVNSKAIIDAREGRKYTALVTSNYHVYRALRYCKKIGLECTGIGSHVAFYYWPSALIREYIAIHSEKKHALIFLAGWLILILPVLISIAAYV